MKTAAAIYPILQLMQPDPNPRKGFSINLIQGIEQRFSIPQYNLNEGVQPPCSPGEGPLSEPQPVPFDRGDALLLSTPGEDGLFIRGEAKGLRKVKSIEGDKESDQTILQPMMDNLLVEPLHSVSNPISDVTSDPPSSSVKQTGSVMMKDVSDVNEVKGGGPARIPLSRIAMPGDGRMIPDVLPGPSPGTFLMEAAPGAILPFQGSEKEIGSRSSSSLAPGEIEVDSDRSSEACGQHEGEFELRMSKIEMELTGAEASDASGVMDTDAALPLSGFSPSDVTEEPPLGPKSALEFVGAEKMEAGSYAIPSRPVGSGALQEPRFEDPGEAFSASSDEMMRSSGLHPSQLGETVNEGTIKGDDNNFALPRLRNRNERPEVAAVRFRIREEEDAIRIERPSLPDSPEAVSFPFKPQSAVRSEDEQEPSVLVEEPFPGSETREKVRPAADRRSPKTGESERLFLKELEETERVLSVKRDIPGVPETVDPEAQRSILSGARGVSEKNFMAGASEMEKSGEQSALGQTRIPAREISRQVADFVLYGARGKEEKLRLTLDPPQLGSIFMEIHKDRDSIRARVWTEDESTREILNAHHLELKKVLELDGFKLDKFEVFIQRDAQSYQDGGEGHPLHRDSEPKNSKRGGEAADLSGSVPPVPEGAEESRRRPGRLDLFA
jgi:hypothetical protein